MSSNSEVFDENDNLFVFYLDKARASLLTSFFLLEDGKAGDLSSRRHNLIRVPTASCTSL